MNSSRQKESGFTLIEMIVSLALFSVVITIAVGALLSLISANKQLQNEQSVMTNLSFALDSMTREIRTGTDYFCENVSNIGVGSLPGGVDNIFDGGVDIDAELILGNSTRDCPGGRDPSSHKVQGIAFKEAGNSITGSAGERILYFFDKDEGKIFRRIGTQEAQSIVSSGIHIENAEFFVSGSRKWFDGAPLNEDQASVTLFIEAIEAKDTSGKTYKIQTTITQRTLDI